MSDARGGSTSVRSLLAKFENNANNANNSTSPPSRGRSPTGTNNGGSDRPLSKVRASFVAVERVASPNSQGGPQQLWGLRKASDVVSSPDKPKVEGLGSPLSRSAAVSPTSSVDKPVLERVPTMSPPSSVAEMKNNLEEKLESKADDSPARSPTGDASDKVDECPGNKLAEEPKEESVALAPKAEEKSKATFPKKQSTTSTAAKTARPPNIATGKDASKVAPSKRSPRDPMSPPLPRTPRTPATSGQRQASTTTNTPAGKKEVERSSRITSKRPSTTRASSHPAGRRTVSKTRSQPSGLSKENNGDRASTNTSPGSTRGKPKSPTRPVRLPASITATTASSAAKLKSEAQTSRPGSRATGPATTTSKTLPAKGPAANLRTNSTIRKAASHASLAPAARISERPRSRVSNVTSKTPNDSFLARMMRPTASSASKAHEKVEIKSPPRSTVRKTPQQRKVSGKQQSGRQSAQSKTSSRASSAEGPVTNGEAVAPLKEERSDVAPESEQLPPMKEVEGPIVEEEPKEEKAPEEIPLPAETEAEI